jgi:hypothetical protein
MRFRPYSVDDRLPDFLRFLGEVFFRLCEAAFSSAFANADASDLLVDMPDSVALVESGRSLRSDGYALISAGRQLPEAAKIKRFL